MSPAGFDELIAGARAVIVFRFPANDIHTGGHTIIANAAKFGKPLIVPAGSQYKSYLEPGKTALLLPPGIANRFAPPSTAFSPIPTLVAFFRTMCLRPQGIFRPKYFLSGFLRP